MDQKGNLAISTLTQLLVGARSFNEAQEALRVQERKRWQIEREHLLKRIKELEETVTSLVTHGSTAAHAPTITTDHIAPAQSTERAIWQGSESISTRTFSDSTVPQVTGTENSENAERKKSVGFDFLAKPTATRHGSLAGVDGGIVHPDYSGITIKSSALSAEMRHAAHSSNNRSPSPRRMPDIPEDSRPQTAIRPKLLDIPTANMHSEELYSVDAGHTPLARVIGSEGTTGAMTPVNAEKPHTPPTEPQQVRPKIPSERQDSYFANIQANGLPDEDPALKEPLGVSADNNEKDADFLEKVNESLTRQLSQQLDDNKLSPPAPKGHRRGLSEAEDGGPKLRLKQSMNFGMPFGKTESGREM